jgi:hypothetical protein
MRLPVKKLYCVELLSECPKMRNLVIARITELWDDEFHPIALDLALNELHNLSNVELLEVLEDIITMECEGE